MIVISSFKLVIDTYFDDAINPDTIAPGELGFREFLDILDYTFNGIFIFELIVKVISLGFVLDYETYLRDSWSQMDFIIVMFSIIDMSLAG